MVCSAKCSCFLCRELQSCNADSKKYGKSSKMCDNFILKKTEAFESSSAMKFIRGAARLSVRHWQSKEAFTPARNQQRLSASKSNSCEQLYPLEKEMMSFKMQRTPSTEHVAKVNNYDHKPLFRILGNSRLKNKFNSESNDANKCKKSLLNFMKNDSTSHVHEKYIPIPQISAPIIKEHIYSEPKLENRMYDRCLQPPLPVYQCVEKNHRKKDESPGRNPIYEKKIYNNRPPCYEELAQKLSQDKNRKSASPPKDVLPPNKITQSNNKIVIYFGDSIIRKHNEFQERSKSNDCYKKKNEVIYANRLLEETANLGLSKDSSSNLVSEVEINNEDIYSEIVNKVTDKGEANNDSNNINDATYKKEKDDLGFGTITSDGVINVEFKENFECARKWVDIISGRVEDFDEATILENDEELFDWSFIQGWRKRPSNGCRPHMVEDAPTAHVAQLKHVPAIASSATTALLQPSKAGRLRIPNPNHHRLSKDLSPDRAAYVITHAHGNGYMQDATQKSLISPKTADSTPVSGIQYASDDIVIKNGYGPMMAAPLKISGPQIKSVTVPSKITVQSTPVKSQNPMNSYGLERKKDLASSKERRAGVGAESSPPPHQHVTKEVTTPIQNGGRECGSSSDENRSSGHASMSDSGGGGAEREQRGEVSGARAADGEEPRARSRASTHHARARHRQQTNKLQSPWPGGGGLEDIRSAIKQLTLRSRDCTSTGTSATSSATGSATNSAAGDSARRRRAPLVRQPSLDTVCTNVTSADEFVWVDSHNRLVELHLVPWSAGEVSRLLSAGRCRDYAPRLSPDTPPRLAYMLQRALVRVAREAQRLAHNFGFCSKHEVAGAFRIVLSTTLAESCIKGCQRAATMFAMSGDAALRQSKAARANTQLSPGKFHRWMVDMRLAPFIHEYAAIYLCAGMETLFEEILMLAMAGSAGQLTPSLLEQAIANSAELWGLLQPYAHLNAGRVATGALSLSRWASLSSLGSGGSTNSGTNNKPDSKIQNQLGLSHDSGITTNSSGGSGSGTGSSESARSVLLTTCVGSACELRAVLRRAPPAHVHSSAVKLAPQAEHALYYFMRCSQLEHSNSSSGAQELWYERAYGVLPPLGEWLRVAAAHAELRGAAAVDGDDIQQAARLLLPGVDCAPRPLTMEDTLEPRRASNSKFSSSGYRIPASEESSRASLALAHRLLATGRPEMVSAARSLLPSTGLDSVDHNGLTALMKAAVTGDQQVVAMLLEAGADPNVETPGCATQHALLLSPRSPSSPAVPTTAGSSQANASAPHSSTTAGWTALVYACAGGGARAVACCARLLAGGARVEGAAGRSDDVCTLTPLQVACGIGNLELVQLLLQHGAHPFLSTLLKDSLCYSGSAQRGCYSAISVCCTHGQRACLRSLLAHPTAAARHADVLSLEEILAEGAGGQAAVNAPALASYTKTQLRSLQEAMYHAAETNHLDITLELRALGVSWTLHAWMLSLAAAADAAAETIIDQLLQDFLQVCPSDDSHYSRSFIYDCLPLLFNIFRYSKKEGTILLLADILCACYGWEPVPAVREPPPATQHAVRIDPSFVNNPELSDVTFRVEGRLFYGHKIVLVTESPRFRAMLAPARGGATEPPSAAGAAPGPASPSATQPPIVQINDIRYHIFQQVMKFLYSGGCSTLDIPETDVLEVLAAASFFQLLPLQRHCEARAARALDLHNLVSVYIHAKVYNAQQLLEYCQGFLLQNMVALLTYDDSVKRLLFGKRLPGHNVLGALLTTLQQRIEARKNNSKNKLACH